MRELRLEVLEFGDLTRWRWRLTGAGGKFLADHEVRLDKSCWQYEAFADLLGYLSWHAAPDQWDEDEARIVGEVGAWIGAEVLGPVAAALVKQRPATVRVVVPEAAKALLFRPLELAHVNGTPIALQDITLVMEPETEAGAMADGPDSVPADGRLRVLGLFSLPEGGQPLNLRRERFELVQLVRGIAAAGRRADVRVLQYGVTRRRLEEVLEEAEGWDVIHVSGHGMPGELLLEKEDGTPDAVSSGELADMLDLARDRVKLVTLSACWSAAVTAEEQRRQLGLPLPDSDGTRGVAGRREEFDSGVLATELTDRLGCAVLAMRYPVGDEFAIALSGKLYELLADRGQPLPRAVGMALRQVLTSNGDAAEWPALSAATPAVFGGSAVGLTLRAPERDSAESYATGALKMAGFPPQPDRFVGRTGVMARASAALAAGSRVPGVLLHGMPGGGKTACALELAYTHEHAFDRLVWYKAPDEGLDITGALTDFALTLERELPDFQMIQVLADDAKLNAFVPKLTELVERRRVLIVIDNIESLLSEGGRWRDERWGTVVAALCAHKGLGRMLLTSRRLVTPGLPGVLVQAVDALTLDEALLLLRELPHLRALIRGDAPGMDQTMARRLALGLLNVAQGHPKLLELANGQAGEPERIGALVEAGDQAWRDAGGLPDGFFTTGETSASGADYLHVLGTWTRAVTETLTAGERTLFWFLCCLEEPDRERPVLDDNWADLWGRLSLDGQPTDLDRALRAIAAQGLAAVRGESESYAIHPGVAAAGREQAGEQFQDAVDAEAAAYWAAVAQYTSGDTSDGRMDTGLTVRAGLAAVPYLLRLQQWTAATTMLEHAFIRDPSRAHAAAVLPAIREITDHDARQAGVLAMVLEVLDPAAAERQMRTFLDAAVARGDYRAATVAAGRLVYLCYDSGRLAEALKLTERKADYTRQAGLGPWTQLLDQVRRLQVLNATGQAKHVLTEVQRLRDHMQTLPTVRGQDESVFPWDVRETLLDTGRTAARQLGQWDDALDLNAAQAACMRDRGAPAAEIARATFNDYGPLLELGRINQALAILLECRQVFQDARDIGSLGQTLSALADIESRRGHGDAAIRLECDALRHKYLAGDVIAIMVSYHNLGNCLHRHVRQSASALACHLASALICDLTGAEGVEGSLGAAVIDLRTLGAHATTPVDLAGLCRQVGDIPGADLDRLLAALTPDPDALEQRFQELVGAVREAANQEQE
jgi:tetratricopeptide (TPR) repeat protein